MEIELTVMYTRTCTLVVPDNLACDKDGNYPDRDAFDAWVSDEADKMTKEGGPLQWWSTEACETENWNEVYSAS